MPWSECARTRWMERYTDSGGEQPRCPNLSQKISEYHLGLTARLDDETRTQALAALQRGRVLSPTNALQAVADALRLRVDLSELPPLCLLHLSGSTPELAFAGHDAAAAASAALAYLRRALRAVPAATDDAISLPI